MRASPSRLSSCIEWAFPIRTIVGAGQRKKVPSVLSSWGACRPLVVTDPGLAKQPFFNDFLSDMSKSGLSLTAFTDTHPNPLDTDVANGAEVFNRANCDSVICIGGGSGMDAGKCIALVAQSKLKLAECDYFSESPPVPEGGRLVPCITIPTTAGTGAEMDSGSMYTDTAAKIKRCAGHQALPLTAILDAELSVGLPPNLTAWTGMDALVHALEAFFVPMYHPMCDGIALQAMQKINENLLRAVRDGSDLQARHEMLVASAMAGVSFQKGLGAVHGLSEPIGAVYDTHHGLTNAIILPHVLRDLDGSISAKCCEISHMLKLPTPGVAGVVDWVEHLNSEMQIPRSLGGLLPKLDEGAVDELASKAAANPTGFGNAAPFDVNDYRRIIASSM